MEYNPALFCYASEAHVRRPCASSEPLRTLRFRCAQDIEVYARTTPPIKSSELPRGCANRRVAYVSRSSKKAVESLSRLPSMKSYQPIGAASNPTVPLRKFRGTL